MHWLREPRFDQKNKQPTSLEGLIGALRASKPLPRGAAEAVLCGG